MNKFGTAVILAGGESSRMGFDKQTLEIDNKRLIYTLASELKQKFNEIIISTNKPKLYIDTDYKLVSDEYKHKGPLSGLYSCLKTAKSEFVYFIACDMPIISLEYISHMKDELKNENFDACCGKFGAGFEPFNAFYSKNILNTIHDILLTENTSMKNLIESINTKIINIHSFLNEDGKSDLFFNLNTFEELNKFTKQ
ncbi:molybdenum cofactor guanylyltransferase [bacterium]